MNKATIERALKLYGVEVRRILPPQSGYRNVSFAIETNAGAWLNFVLFKHEKGIVARVKRTDAVAAYLHEHRFPTRTVADPRILQLGSSRLGRFAGLYHYLPGRTIPWEAYTMEHLKLLGKTMSNMHATLVQFPHAGELPDVIAEYQTILERMQTYFQTPGVQVALRNKCTLAIKPGALERTTEFLRLAEHLQPTQALHMDFVRSNVLFDTNSAVQPNLCGILDFEKAARGHPLFDIARSLAFLLVDCKYKSTDKIRKYFLLSGYHKRGQADFQNIHLKTRQGNYDVLETLINMFLLYDFYKFLKHNPYESLAANEHYQRTVQLLISRGKLRLL